MRVTTFLLFFCFLLFSGKNFASTVVVKKAVKITFYQNVLNHKQYSMSVDDQNTIESDDVDFDLDEDFNVDTNHKNFNTLFSHQSNLGSTFYKTVFSFKLLDNYSNIFKTFPHLNGNSCPIYIVQRVIRI